MRGILPVDLRIVGNHQAERIRCDISEKRSRDRLASNNSFLEFGCQRETGEMLAHHLFNRLGIRPRAENLRRPLQRNIDGLQFFEIFNRSRDLITSRDTAQIFERQGESQTAGLMVRSDKNQSLARIPDKTRTLIPPRDQTLGNHGSRR